MADAIGAILFGQKSKGLDHLNGAGAGTATMAHALPQQFQTTLFPGGKLPEEPKTC